MVDIVSKYHKQLQEKPQMNMARRRAINKWRKHIKEKFHNVEITELKDETSAEEAKEAI